VIGNVSAWQASDSSWRKNDLHNQPAAITSRRMDRTDAGLVPAVGQGSWERVVSKKYVPRSPGPIRNFQKPTEGSIRIFRYHRAGQP
jgi:hypothetical protein